MDPIKPFPKRRAPGKYGGRHVQYQFYFAPRDDDKYPSESHAIRNNRLPDDPNKVATSWVWALNYAQVHDVWLVVPIRGIDEDSVKANINVARASIWRTGHRHGLELTSEYVYPNLYVKVV